MNMCHNVEEQLSLLVDEQLPPPLEAAVRAHVSECDTCRGIVDDLIRLTATARTLGPIHPPMHVQQAIAAAVDPSSAHGAGGGWKSWPWAAIAATLVAVTAAAAWLTTARPVEEPAVDTSAAAMSVVEELNQAALHYERAIDELEALPPGRGPLSPELASIVRANVDVIDRAITESRRALQIDPMNEPARVSLFEALQRKVDLLQATALLIEDEDTETDGTVVPAVLGRQS
jgi:hypothetical protein